jgi:chorismate mutase
LDKPAPSLETIRARIDVIDAELLRLVDERASLAKTVAEAKRAAGDGDKIGIRPVREAQLVRHLLATPKTPSSGQGASAALTVRLWRELISDSLAQQGPFHLSVWGGGDPGRAVELARLRFGAAPPMRQVAQPLDALTAAKTAWGVGVLALAPDNGWWGRLLAEPRLRVFAAMPCLAASGPLGALAVAELEVEPSGADETYWVTDAPEPPARITEALSRDGVAAHPLAQAGGLKLFALAGFYQREDARLARAPGRMSGVIGAAPVAFDL